MIHQPAWSPKMNNMVLRIININVEHNASWKVHGIVFVGTGYVEVSTVFQAGLIKHIHQSPDIECQPSGLFR